MRLGVWTPLPHTIPPEPAMDEAVRALGRRGSGFGETDKSFDFAVQVIRKAEAWGYETTLIAERFLGPDLESWILSSALAALTTRIEIMVAVHPGIVLPQVVAKMGASLDRVSGGRFALNVVNGWWPQEFNVFGNGAWIDEASGRYRRMDEFVRVIKGLWTEDRFSFAGEFYRVHDGALPIKTCRTPAPPIYAASRAEAGKNTIARDGDVWFVAYAPQYRLADENIVGIARDVAEMNERAARFGRRIGFGISAHVICADSLAAAETRVAALEAHGKTDRVAAVAAMALGPGLVGEPERIAERILHLDSLGVDCFMLHFHPMMEGLEIFTEKVMPLVRKGARESLRPLAASAE